MDNGNFILILSTMNSTLFLPWFSNGILRLGLEKRNPRKEKETLQSQRDNLQQRNTTARARLNIFLMMHGTTL